MSTDLEIILFLNTLQLYNIIEFLLYFNYFFEIHKISKKLTVSQNSEFFVYMQVYIILYEF